MNNDEKYIIVSSSDCKNHWGWCSNLGHELFFTRKIVFILFINNLINENYIIVTSNEDRKFLYSSIFNKVITYNDFLTNNILLHNDNVIDLCPYLLSLYAADINFLNSIGAPNGSTMNCLKNFGLNENMLCDNKIFQNCNTESLNELSCKLDYLNLDNSEFKNIINSDFFIIHIKNGSKYLNYIYEIIQKFGINCIIFTQSTNVTKDFLQTSDLRMYATLLNNKNCKFFITEWSGGGQLAQFCCNSKIVYYYDCYPEHYFNDKEQLYRDANNSYFYDLWDHYTPINCKRVFLTKNDFEDINILKNICLYNIWNSK